MPTASSRPFGSAVVVYVHATPFADTDGPPGTITLCTLGPLFLGTVSGLGRVFGNLSIDRLYYLCKAIAAPDVGEQQATIDASGRLELIVVDDGKEMLQTEARRRQRGFPHGAFLQLAVTQQHHGAGVGLGQLLGHGDAHPHRQRMAQRPGGKLNARSLLRRVSGEAAAQATRTGQLACVDLAQLNQARVQRRHRMALTHEEVIGMLRGAFETQVVEEQRRHDVGTRHGTAEVGERH
jgi:hypothetical protein